MKILKDIGGGGGTPMIECSVEGWKRESGLIVTSQSTPKLVFTGPVLERYCFIQLKHGQHTRDISNCLNASIKNVSDVYWLSNGRLM